MAEKTTAVAMAKKCGVDPKTFRAALRRANLSWHIPGHRWIVNVGSGEYWDMETVLRGLKGRRDV